jgi:Ca-activated chloride channel family protein
MAWHDAHKKRGPRFPLRLITAVSVVAILSTASSLNKATGQEPDEVIRIRTDLVTIPLVVTDSRGHRIPNLKREDFVLTDYDSAAKIDYFASGTERVALLFALDASGSEREIFAQQRQAALALFSRFGPGSRVAVLHFANYVRLSVPFTTDSGAAQAAFNSEPGASGGTAIFDGAAAAVRCFDGSGGFSMERRIVLLMSDGLDTLSSTKYSEVVAAARDRGVSFYVIHFQLFTPGGGRLVPRLSVKGFRELADQTGGRYFRIGDAKSALDPHAHYDLAPVFEAIDNDLRGQYVLGFYPREMSRDGQPHAVAIGLAKRNSKLRVLQVKTTYRLSK